MSESVEMNGAGGYAIKGLDANRVWTYDKTVIDFNALTQRTLDLAVVRAFSHVLGSEVSAKVGGTIDKLIAEGKATKADRDSESVMFEELKQQYRAEYADEILSDDWGLGKRGPSGPRLDPVETVYQRELEKETRKYVATVMKPDYNKTTKLWTVTRRINGEPVVGTMSIEQACALYLKRHEGAKDRLEAFARNFVELRKANAEAKQTAPVPESAIIEDDELDAAA